MVCGFPFKCHYVCDAGNLVIILLHNCRLLEINKCIPILKHILLTVKVMYNYV